MPEKPLSDSGEQLSRAHSHRPYVHGVAGGCGGGAAGCADCVMCESCCGRRPPGQSSESPRSGSSGSSGSRELEEPERELSTFVVHVGERSFTVQSTAASLVEFKSPLNIRALRHDFAAKLGIDDVDALPEVRVDDAFAEINPRARGFASGKSNRRRAQRIVDNHAVEWKRVAQLAVPEVAAATGPRFCDGGVDAEKAVVCEGLLGVLEDAGWKLRKAIDRIWAGGRSIEEIAVAGEDEDDKAILSHVLSQIVGDLAELRAKDPSQRERLDYQEHATARARLAVSACKKQNLRATPRSHCHAPLRLPHCRPRTATPPLLIAVSPRTA